MPLPAGFSRLQIGLHSIVAILIFAAWFTQEGMGRALTVLLFAGLFHGAFHLWRHTALFDGALWRITLPALHCVL